MAKLGDEYQAMVGAVERALDPGAKVTVGDWREGPDGMRDMDVSVEGLADGKPCFVLIECKDWTRPVGIGVIDALESKRHDLKADAAVIYSNSGFTKQALLKAQRVGIRTLSLIKQGDERVRVALKAIWLAKVLSIDKWSFVYFPINDTPVDLPSDSKPSDLTYRDLPVVNWLCPMSAQVLSEHETASSVQLVFAFRREEEFKLAGRSLRLRGLGVVLKCSKKWVSQVIDAELTLGIFDYLRNSIVLPSQQALALGPVDNTRWEETREEWPDMGTETEGFDLRLTLINPIHPEEGEDAPKLDDLIAEKEIRVLEEVL